MTSTADKRLAAEAAPDTAFCKHCGNMKARHGKMGFSCPAGTPGKMFEPLPEPKLKADNS